MDNLAWIFFDGEKKGGKYVYWAIGSHPQGKGGSIRLPIVDYKVALRKILSFCAYTHPLTPTLVEHVLFCLKIEHYPKHTK